MQIEETLRICLHVLECRYPNHFVDLNEAVLGLPCVETKGWKAQEIIHFLQLSTPNILSTPALLVIDPQKSEIYLLDHSDQTPAMVIHCQGRVVSTRRCQV